MESPSRIQIFPLGKELNLLSAFHSLVLFLSSPEFSANPDRSENSACRVVINISAIKSEFIGQHKPVCG